MAGSNELHPGIVRARLEFPVWYRGFTKTYVAWSNAPGDLKIPLLLQGPALAKAEGWLLACPEKLSESQKRFIVRSIAQRAKEPFAPPTATTPKRPVQGKWRRPSDRSLWHLYAVIALGMWIFSPDILRDAMESVLNPPEARFASGDATKSARSRQLTDAFEVAGDRSLRAPADATDGLAPVGDIDETPPLRIQATLPVSRSVSNAPGPCQPAISENIALMHCSGSRWQLFSLSST